MKKKIQMKTSPVLTAHQICIMMKFNQNTRDYIFHRYIDKLVTRLEWEHLFKKDGLNF